jgi:arylsulfatase
LKGSVDEGGVRVPFFLRWDGRITPGRDIDQIVAHLDLLPTLAELAGAPTPPGQVEGRSLLPLIENADATWPDRYLFSHQGRWPTGAEPNDFQWKNFAVRNQRFRLVGKTQLYDMQRDPSQTTNVIQDHPQVADAMLAAYDAWWKETRPMMVNEDVPMSPTRPFHEAYRKQMESTGIPEWKPAE